MSAHPVTVTLPDGKTRSFDGPVTGTDLAASIGPGLAKAALAWKVDGELWDIFRPLDHDARVAIVTAKDPEALELVRHDAAHLLAQAVQELYPGTQVTIGPVIEDGFYYDFARDEPFHPDDLAKIEARMKEIVDEDRVTRREVMPRNEAIAHFEAMGETYKAELIRDLPGSEEIRIYHHGPWHDLCRGPHLASTAKIGKAFKLMKIAGAYWRGDHRNPMLQRIYGTAWMSEKDLEAHLHRLEEAEKRDHRKLGRELDLFHIQEEAQGMIFWHPKGWTVYRELESYIRRKTSKVGYVEVKTPQLVDRKLWEMSGHWEKFRENMFTTETEDEKVLALKPMNCPCHVQIFNQGLKSYRDLPILMAEFGSCHRYEPSGSLHGLMRVRNFVQDDAHIFCTEGQTTSESEKFCQLILECYRELGFSDVSVKFSDRPPVRAGSDETWDRAEAALKAAVEHVGLEYTLNPGEGAFYGPKLEFVLRDAIGRDWQCGTLQMDFVLPERLGASYIGEDGEKHRPVMLHRAILGSLERFIGILIEEHAGKFPLWLAPVQAMVTTITSEADDYAQSVFDRLKTAGIRAAIDLRNEKINLKVREHSIQKIPVIAVAGRREAEEGTVTLRRLGSQDQVTVRVEDFVASLLDETRPPDLVA